MQMEKRKLKSIDILINMHDVVPNVILIFMNKIQKQLKFKFFYEEINQKLLKKSSLFSDIFQFFSEIKIIKMRFQAIKLNSNCQPSFIKPDTKILNFSIR